MVTPDYLGFYSLFPQMVNLTALDLHELTSASVSFLTDPTSFFTVSRVHSIVAFASLLPS